MSNEGQDPKPPYVRVVMPDECSIVVGQRLVMDGQIFTILRIDRFQRRDGTFGAMVSWSAPCAACGETFYGISVCRGGFPSRRCKTHRAMGRPVRGPGKRRRVSIEWLPPEERAGVTVFATTGPASA